MDDETEIIDSPTDTEATETEGTEVAEPAVDVAKLQEANKKLFERAKKAEDALKAAKKAPKPAEQTVSQQPEATDVEEIVLKAQGMDLELLKQLKEVSQFKGISLIDAQKDPLFVAVKNDFEATQRSKAAAVGASRGSGAPAVKATLSTGNLSREDHKALFRERLGR